MPIYPRALKIAADLIERRLQQQLPTEQQAEPADQPHLTTGGTERHVRPGVSVLRHIAPSRASLNTPGESTRPTATEPGAKVLRSPAGARA